MNLIINTILFSKLNKNLCLVIYKYLDYSEKNLLKYINENKYILYSYLSIPVIDVVLIALRNGYIFYLRSIDRRILYRSK
jgi:hypothetical protein